MGGLKSQGPLYTQPLNYDGLGGRSINSDVVILKQYTGTCVPVTLVWDFGCPL